MSEHGLTPDPVRVARGISIAKSDSFEPQGISDRLHWTI